MSLFAIEPGQSRLATVEQLTEMTFRIPPFQRPYDWEDAQVDDLMNDLCDAERKEVPLFLGLVVLCPDKDNSYAIVDGQQRLTSLMLAIAAKGAVGRVLRSDASHLSTLWVAPRVADIGFTRAMLGSSRESERTLSQKKMSAAFDRLRSNDSFQLDTVLKAQVIVYVAPSLAGATSLFERINLRGKEVSQFDLVKNKLIEWLAVECEPESRSRLEEFITERYDTLYQRLDPRHDSQPFNADRLLRTHWILFTDKQFKSSDRVLEKVNDDLSEAFQASRSVAHWIQDYLNSLVEVTETWAAVERPFESMPTNYGAPLRKALLDFARLDRHVEFQPLIVAAIIRWRDAAADLVRICEISSFRSALGKRNSNRGRSYKWRVARQLYKGDWRDATGSLISSARDAVHQVYWHVTPFWDTQEATDFGYDLTPQEAAALVFPNDALDSAHFYTEYGHITHYLFWKYGVFLPKSDAWRDHTREDMSPFQDPAWFGKKDGEVSFQNWDIEHIYPQNADDRDTRDGRRHKQSMASWLHHLGNITVLPIRDNRGMKNLAFTEKLSWMRAQRKVSFNELLANADYRGNLMDRPHWGINNCRKRVAQIRSAAAEIWGPAAVASLGVEQVDERLEWYEADGDEQD
ncbi:conserved hypothetical protein [Paraburkholderia caribensis]|uniref:GmrSD restriction endonuclease domain-containing protein n=1 Tax=Paraburkholderia caribensis TaxID=75105 RepID=UPI001CB509D2|nr:DUF262 domain-containing protein [Paraburkholderia caribensis]CAG9229821.1 conserved hypothetical protein [Paraburkholderia caribensis]